MRALLAVLVGALCAGAIACAARPRSTEPAAQASGDMQADPRAEIERLDREIADELTRAQLAPPPIAACAGSACSAALREPFVTPTRTDPQCHPAAGPRCDDACALADSICANQDRICQLAKQLADDWAANRCESARASCKTAHERCCSCVL